jgi:hypothetical protein
VSDEIEPEARRNLLEWLSSRKVPDAALTIILAFIAALTIAPYLGGRTIWGLGSNTVTVPQIPVNLFWVSVIGAPIVWWLLVSRFIGQPSLKVFSGAMIASILSAGAAAWHLAHPEFALDRIAPNFDETYRFEFIETQKSWVVARQATDEGVQYCHFKTPVVSLGSQVRRGCVLRVDRLEFEGVGSAQITGRSGFDFEAYLLTDGAVAPAAACSTNFQSAITRPDRPAVMARAVYIITPEDLGLEQDLAYSLGVDFKSKTMEGKPALARQKQIESSDVIPGDDGAKLQLSGWTAWGKDMIAQIDEMNIRVRGRLQCGLAGRSPPQPSAPN